MSKLRVFVSSVSRRFEDGRRLVMEQLNTAGYDLTAMESFGAQPSSPIDVCLNELRSCDVAVLIVGPHYGSTLPTGISYTHTEFREARRLNIPVLAFRVPDEATLSQREQTQIEEFQKEVGKTNTLEIIRPESAGLLPAKVLAALTSARDRGELGTKYQLIQPWERHFAGQLGYPAGPLSHDGPYVGREVAIRAVLDFIAGKELLFLLRAPGGSGKSRLLLEASKAACAIPGSPHIRFVDPGAPWSDDSLNLLPTLPTVLVLDDAHRRPDLDRLIAAALQRNSSIRFVVSCRPSAVNAVQRFLAPVTAASAPVSLDLPPLPRPDALTLARQVLGPTLQHLAERLVDRSDGNPLVITVGARCIADSRVAPELLDVTPEQFRIAVLDRLLNDPALSQADAGTRRHVLNVLSAIGPAISDSDDLVKPLSKALKTPPSAVRTTLASLEKSGFLQRRGRLVRVTPDVLSDHILHRAAIDDSGEPTGFIEEMIEEFAPAMFENILANAAELDWRTGTGSAGEPVLNGVWQSIEASLPQSPLTRRAELLKQLRRAAVFAPERVLALVEWTLDHPTAPPDPQLEKWGIHETPEAVTDAATQLLDFLAGHPDLTTRCLTRLWRLSAGDGDKKGEADRARAYIKNRLKYKYRSGWNADSDVQATTAAFVVAKLLDPKRNREAAWAIDALGEVMHRTGDASRSDRLVFTISSFELGPHIADLSSRRGRVVLCLQTLTLSDRPAESAVALQQLGNLLSAPLGPLGRVLTPEEADVWLPEAETAIAILKTAGTTSHSDVIRFLARRELREVRDDHWPALLPKVKQALADVPPVEMEHVFDLFIGTPWSEQLDDMAAEDRRIESLCAKAAQSLWKAHREPASLVTNLLSVLSTMHAIFSLGDRHTGQLGQAIVRAQPEEAESVVRALILSGEEGWRLLRPVLNAVHGFDKPMAEKLVLEAVASKTDQLQAYGLDAMQSLVDRATNATDLLQRVSPQAGAKSEMVRIPLARLLGRFRKSHSAEALAILTSIEWSDSPNVATAVLDVLHPQYGLDPALISPAGIDELLGRIRRLPSLEGRRHEILQFVAYASTRRPRQTTQMLLDRISDAETDNRETRGKREERRTPMPHGGYGLTLPGLPKSAEYAALLRLIRDGMLTAKGLMYHWLPELFAVAASDLSVALQVLREWAESGDATKIHRAAMLLRGFEHDIIFGYHDFMANLLDAAEVCGGECLKDVGSSLFCVALSGSYSGTPGQPAPRHLSSKANAEELAEHYKNRPAAHKFYRDIVAHAEGRIKWDQERWEEEGDE